MTNVIEEVLESMRAHEGYVSWDYEPDSYDEDSEEVESAVFSELALYLQDEEVDWLL